RSSVLSNFEHRLFNTLKNPNHFNELLGEALGFSPSWTIDQSDQGQYFLKFFNGRHSHSSDGMGEGIVSVFSIIDSLYDSKAGDVVVIDEPELSLHPSLQKRVKNLLVRFSSDRQIIISTHSPYFVDVAALSAGAQLIRVVSSGDGTLIHQLSSKARASMQKLATGNLHNPHVFGLDARELFFLEDQVILTEGQEDVLLIPAISEQMGFVLPGNLFGWGAGGASNIAHLCHILSDLGFAKVAAIFDADKQGEAQKCKAEFPNYFFLCIPAKDIRDKPPRRPTETVEGLLDQKLIVKAQYVAETKAVFNELTAYMKTLAINSQ